MSYVVTQWKANNEAVDGEGSFVLIKARRAGLLSFILKCLKIEARFALKISCDRVSLSTSSLTSSQERNIPLENVCSTYYGYHRPLWTALFGTMFAMALLGFIGWQLGGDNAVLKTNSGLLGAIVALVVGIIYYMMNKSLTLGFVEMSGEVNAVAVSGSLIEGVSVDEKAAAYVITLTQALIDDRVAARAAKNA